MKVIDLLNKIANGEEVPKKIKFEDVIYEYDEERKDYIHEINNWHSETLLFKVMNCHYIREILETRVELIEENTIDIDSIEELNDTCYDRHFYSEEKEYYHNLTRKVLNKVIRIVKQHDKEIKELKEK